MAQTCLHPVVRGHQHGVPGDLRTGAGGGGDGDAGQGPLGQETALTDHFQVIEGIAFVDRQRCDGLAAVQGAAAAEGDDEVCLPGPGPGSSLPDTGEGRFTGQGEEGGLEPMGTEQFQQALAAGAIASGHHKGPPTQPLGQGPRFRQHAHAEDNALGGGELEAHHQPSSPGKTLEYFRADRGSAIMSPTVPAQAA